MRYTIAHPLKKLALCLRQASIFAVIDDSWRKSNKNPQQFIEKQLNPRIPNWGKLYDGAPLKEINTLKKDVLDATDNKVEVQFKGNNLEFIPARS